MDIEILYEDNEFIVVNKPNNMLVHGSYYARNLTSPTLLDLLLEQRGEKLFPVHRLDHKTSGVLILAKSAEMTAQLQLKIEDNSLDKKYLALLRGYTPPTGTIDSPVKSAATGKYKEALTEFTTLQSVEIDIPVVPYPQSRYSLVEFSPKTGRMHQLRIHANKISHPIIGDHKYGNRHHNKMFAETLFLPNLFLHAASVEFTHPITNERLKITAKLPEFWGEMRGKIGLGFVE